MLAVRTKVCKDSLTCESNRTKIHGSTEGRAPIAIANETRVCWIIGLVAGVESGP